MGTFKPKTLQLIRQVQTIIDEYSMPLTLRQIYYRLVAGQIIENKISEYKRLASVLSNARKSRHIDFDDITDRTRTPIKRSSWIDLKDFMETVKIAYQKSKWTSQNKWIEVWVEKDALSGVFEPITNKYDVYLVVGRGYQSLSALNEASQRFPKDKPIYILYFGDFDPTGLDIPRSIEENLITHFGIKNLELEKVSLTLEDIKEHNLPPAPTKISDTRSPKFIKEYGDMAVELDALPPDVLQKKIEDNIKEHLDFEQFEKDLETEAKEIKKFNKLIP